MEEKTQPLLIAAEETIPFENLPEKYGQLVFHPSAIRDHDCVSQINSCCFGTNSTFFGMNSGNYRSYCDTTFTVSRRNYAWFVADTSPAEYMKFYKSSTYISSGSSIPRSSFYWLPVNILCCCCCNAFFMCLPATQLIVEVDGRIDPESLDLKKPKTVNDILHQIAAVKGYRLVSYPGVISTFDMLYFTPTFEEPIPKVRK